MEIVFDSWGDGKTYKTIKIIDRLICWFIEKVKSFRVLGEAIISDSKR